MLWASIGQTFVTSLTALKQSAAPVVTPSVSVSPGEIVVVTSLNRVLDAMDTLRATCPLIGVWYTAIFEQLKTV